MIADSGKQYPSLSEVARIIIGSRWSPPLFFGLKTRWKEEAAGDGARSQQDSLFQKLINIRDAGEGDFTAGERPAL
jgi:hypothetical protein